MFNQPLFGGNPAFQYAGVPQQQPRQNFLTPEQIKSLQAKETGFNIAITEEQRLRGICNHRNPDGLSDALIFDPTTGEAKCSICGYKFRPIEPDTNLDTIKEDVLRLIDILQTIKLMYVDFPKDAGAEYFQIIPMLEKIPQLFDYAAKNSAQHDTYGWQYNNKNMGTVQMFNAITGMFNNGAFQPQYQQPMGAPAGFPNAAYNNPFGYNGYAPANPGFAYNPAPTTAPVQPSVVAPVAPVVENTATVQQTVTV